LLHPRWLAAEKTVYESARVTFTTGTFASQSVVEDYGIDPVRVRCVFSGVNAPSAPAAGDRPFGNLVLFVGIDWERKGGPDLLKAFERVVAAHPQARLRIVGCKPAVRDARVEVIGRVPLDEVSRHLREADVFCMPSLHEPSAVALVEAMMHGLPVVSTRVGGTPDRCVDGETGWLVEPGDTAAIASALIRLLDDPARCRSMGQAAARFAQERFTWGGTSPRESPKHCDDPSRASHRWRQVRVGDRRGSAARARGACGRV
jgi:glycosyltransferase involved in cell wall biosynthesis